uniref:Uncharacterized protein n=1 Tax=Myotis myotis TaxID=51298 RepID=A0A7J7Y014_MYOMY|nr:hypothetical protein mMyoMyo1_011353 [Myotis myotis]
MIVEGGGGQTPAASGSGPYGLLNLMSHPDLAFAEGLTHTYLNTQEVRACGNLADCLREQQISLDLLARPQPSSVPLGKLWHLPGGSCHYPPNTLSLQISVLGPGPNGAHEALLGGPSWVLGAWVPGSPAVEVSEEREAQALSTFFFSPSAHFVWSSLVAFESPAPCGKAPPAPTASP